MCQLQNFTAAPKYDYADWVKRHDASNIVHIMPDGSVRSKDQLMAELRTGNCKLYSLDYGPQDVFTETERMEQRPFQPG